METELRIQLKNSTLSRGKAQTLHLLFKLGMTWDICRQTNELPSRHVLNDFLATGRDDIVVRFGCEESGTIFWTPFELSETEYEDFIDWAMTIEPQLFPDVHSEAKTYQEWFCSRAGKRAV